SSPCLPRPISSGGHPRAGPSRKRRQQCQLGLLHSRAVRPDKAVLPDGNELPALADQTLDLEQEVLPLLAVHLLELSLEEAFDLRERAIRIDALGGGVRLDPRGGVARRAGGAD